MSLAASSGSLVRHAAVDVGRQGHEALGGEAVAGLLDLVVHAPPLLEHDHAPARAAVGQRQVPLTLGAVGCELHDLAHLRTSFVVRSQVARRLRATFWSFQEVHVAKSPDPNIKLTSSKGVTRTLDDWATMFQLCDGGAAAASGGGHVRAGRPPHLPGARRRRLPHALLRASATSSSPGAWSATRSRRRSSSATPTAASCRASASPTCPRFVHLRQDTTLVDAAEGWDAAAWQRVADGIAKAMSWRSPTVAGRDDPPGTPGWPV